MISLIASLEAELVACQTRMDAIRACIAALTPDHAGAPSVRTITANDARGRSAERRGHSGPRPRPNGRADTTATDKTVLAAIKAGHATAKAIEAETTLPPYNVKCALARLVDAKTVTRTGATSSVRYSVGKGGGQVTRAEAPKDSLLGIA